MLFAPTLKGSCNFFTLKPHGSRPCSAQRQILRPPFLMGPSGRKFFNYENGFSIDRRFAKWFRRQSYRQEYKVHCKSQSNWQLFFSHIPLLFSAIVPRDHELRAHFLGSQQLPSLLRLKWRCLMSITYLLSSLWQVKISLSKSVEPFKIGVGKPTWVLRLGCIIKHMLWVENFVAPRDKPQKPVVCIWSTYQLIGQPKLIMSYSLQKSRHQNETISPG